MRWINPERWDGLATRTSLAATNRNVLAGLNIPDRVILRIKMYQIVSLQFKNVSSEHEIEHRKKEYIRS